MQKIEKVKIDDIGQSDIPSLNVTNNQILRTSKLI